MTTVLTTWPKDSVIANNINGLVDLNPLFIETWNDLGSGYNAPLGINYSDNNNLKLTSPYLDQEEYNYSVLWTNGTTNSNDEAETNVVAGGSKGCYTFDLGTTLINANSGNLYPPCITVTGGVGTTQLSSNFNTTNYPAIISDAGRDLVTISEQSDGWAGVVKHVDGTYGVYHVTGIYNQTNSATVTYAATSGSPVTIGTLPANSSWLKFNLAVGTAFNGTTNQLVVTSTINGVTTTLLTYPSTAGAIGTIGTFDLIYYYTQAAGNNFSAGVKAILENVGASYPATIKAYWTGTGSPSTGSATITCYSANPSVNSTPTVTIKPPLKNAVAGSILTNFYDNSNSPHLSLGGFRALANTISNASPIFSNKKNCYYFWSETQTSAQNSGDLYPWTAVGSYNMNNAQFNQGLNIAFAPTLYGTATSFRGQYSLQITAAAGAGVQKAIALNGSAGYVEFWVGLQQQWGNPLPSYPVQINILSNDQTGVFNASTNYDVIEMFPNVYGTEKIKCYFPAGLKTLVIQVLAHPSTTIAPTISIGNLGVYNTPISGYDHQIIPSNSRGILLGDSWSVRGKAMEKQFNKDLSKIGSSLITIAKGSRTTNWAINNWSTLIAPLKPSFVIIEYFTNDYSSANGSGIDVDGYTISLAIWLSNIKTLISNCKAIGAKPIILMPMGAPDYNSQQGIGAWAQALEADIALNNSQYYY